MIAIIDYGMGNIHSVQKALESMGAKTMVTSNPKDIKACDKAVLPGVGAFDDAMLELTRKNLVIALNEHVKNKKIFLGICLGMQLMFEESEEAKESKGLAMLKGRVKRFENKDNLKVPHIGWNQIKAAPQSSSDPATQFSCPLLQDVPSGSYVYFCHSYYPHAKDEKIVAATTDYGINFSSILWQDNIYGVQFHPEKSQEVGLKILKNFVNL